MGSGEQNSHSWDLWRSSHPHVLLLPAHAALRAQPGCPAMCGGPETCLHPAPRDGTPATCSNSRRKHGVNTGQTQASLAVLLRGSLGGTGPREAGTWWCQCCVSLCRLQLLSGPLCTSGGCLSSVGFSPKEPREPFPPLQLLQEGRRGRCGPLGLSGHLTFHLPVLWWPGPRTTGRSELARPHCAGGARSQLRTRRQASTCSWGPRAPPTLPPPQPLLALLAHILSEKVMVPWEGTRNPS